MHKKILVCALLCMSLLCAVLYGASHISPEPVFSVENRKEILYRPENMPAYEGGSGININTASLEELCSLPGIGETIAGRIISHREAYGPYPHPEAIMEVHGIGEKMYEEIKDKICTK